VGHCAHLNKYGAIMVRIGPHAEFHKADRIGWLRASVLGANDGIVSTASLIIGVASAQTPPSQILLSGIAGLVAGAMSMAAGEYVSVSSQADTERADIARETAELAANPEFERQELTQIYVDRGLKPDLARKVAEQLMAHDALKTHARDELGITDAGVARPIQAALASAASFALGAALPLVVAWNSMRVSGGLVAPVAVTSLFFLVLLGAIAARTGGASLLKGALRVGFWGALAMLATAWIGKLFGTVVG
jgi:vacuolar iron transporter family protein